MFLFLNVSHFPGKAFPSQPFFWFLFLNFKLSLSLDAGVFISARRSREGLSDPAGGRRQPGLVLQSASSCLSEQQQPPVQTGALQRVVYSRASTATCRSGKNPTELLISFKQEADKQSRVTTASVH